MARVSRKKPLPEQSLEKTYNVAVYVRLSIEDQRDKKDSDSLELQKSLILDYISNNPNMKVYSIYADNGETGTNFERQEFGRMMSDAYNGNINCIIVKDLSRFGREYIEFGDYLERIFPLAGIRFVSINDNYDNKYKVMDVTIPLKNMINMMYARDVGKKSVAALRMKQKKGEFIGSNPSYGYLKSPDDKHKLIIDEEAAAVVREIFKMKSEGMSYQVICRTLAEKNIIPPSKYMYNKGIFTDERFADKKFWNVFTIKRLLQNRIYLGHMVQGKKRSNFAEGKGTEYVAADAWTIVENTHEPVISRKLFDKVQEVISASAEKYNRNLGKYDALSNDNNLYKGIVVCGDCNTNLTRYKNAKPCKCFYTYVCPTHAKLPSECSFIGISEAVLNEIVLASIKAQIGLLIDLDAALENALKSAAMRKKQISVNKKVKDLSDNIDFLKNKRTQLVADLAGNILSEDEYSYAREQYNLEISGQELLLNQAEAEKEEFEKIFINASWIKELKKYKSIKMLSKDIILAFIKKIIINPNKTIAIYWTYNDQYQALLAALSGGENIA